MLFLESVGRRSELEGAGEFSVWMQWGKKSLNGREHNRLFQNDGRGRFADVSYAAGADVKLDGRSVVAVDFDGDGDLDLALQNLQSRAVLLENQGAPGNWLQVRLRGTESNRDAIGAWVEVEAGGKRQSREVRSTAGYLSGCSLQVHFGLADAERIDVLRVRWPAGAVTELRDLPVNQRLRLVEGERP